jgi:small subunit ribosomal protein S17
VVQETAAATAEPRVNRKGRTGTVVSDKGDKTVIVAVVSAKRHRLYRKVLRRTKHYAVHDPENRATTGDLVRIEECRPISKTKRWRLVDVLTEREVAEVSAAEIDTELVEEVQRAPSRAAEDEAVPSATTETSGASEPAATAEATEPPAASAATDADEVEKAE